jgi:hypothetical protein
MEEMYTIAPFESVLRWTLALLVFRLQGVHLYSLYVLYIPVPVFFLLEGFSRQAGT